MRSQLLENLRRAHGPERLRVEGALPPGLKGTLYRAGPALFERFGKRVLHPFEADGAVSAVRFSNGEATGAVRIIESDGYLEEEEKQKNLYSSAASYPRRLKMALSQKGKVTGNTSVLAWQGRIFALYEGGPPTELDPEQLDTLGTTTLSLKPKMTFSAHPHRVASLGCTFNFGVRYERKMHLDVFSLPDRGPASRLAHFCAPWQSMVHDFVATQTHLAFLIAPAKLVLWKAALQLGSFGDWFKWTPQLGAQLVVVPLETPDRVQRFEVEPFWVWHFANAFSEGNKLTIDMCKYSNLDSLSGIADDRPTELPRLVRGTLDLGSGRFEMEQDTMVAEFPVVHPKVSGQRHRLAWIVTAQEGAVQPEAIAKVNVETGHHTIWQPSEDVTVSEPVLAPRGRDEDDVWVLTLMHDAKAQKSCIAVLDGRALEAGPTAKVWFDQTIPMTFHGTFVPSAFR